MWVGRRVENDFYSRRIDKTQKPKEPICLLHLLYQYMSAMCGPLTMLVVTKMDMVQWNLELRGAWVTKWIEGSLAEMRHT